MGKARLKRWVLRAFLNDDSVGAFYIWCGNEFHREGAATGNALSPQVRHLVLGICRRLASADLRHREGACWWRRSARKGVARLLRAL